MYPIPANATRIRYLESTGTQYVDTGIVPNSATTSVFIRTFLPTGSTAAMLFGSRSAANRNAYDVLYYPHSSANTDRLRYDFGDSTTATVVQNLILGVVSGWTEIETRGNEIVLTGSGSTTTATAQLSAAINSFHIFVFGINNGGTPVTTTAPVRISSFRLFESGVPVRSFVPVRVGTVGYLFDRVSGQLFGNAGTGDFVLGPDTFAQGVVPTRMMAMGVRKKLPTTWDYVQDGLYYQLDGIENAGRGVHSATATTWTDLTGNGHDATFLNAASGLVWQDDAAYLYGKTHDGMAKIAGLPSMTAFTFEFVSRMDAKDDYARMYDSEAYGVGAKRFASLFGTSNYPLAMSFLLANNGDQNYNLIPVSTSARSCAVTPNVSGSSYSARVCVNGVFVQSGAAKSASGVSAATYIDVANRSNTPNRGFDGAVYAIRVYNRILTDAEIAANYAIDKARFNLP